jgi:peptidoglycan/xylan/chitin deacetylase (PgdA/CDA1 family)
MVDISTDHVTPQYAPDRTRVALVFDDGFLRSCLTAAKLFESRNMRATFAVLAEPAGFAPGLGNFDLWNEFVQRGHRVDPHGWHHDHLDQLPPEQAIDGLRRCLDAFAERLAGFNTAAAVFHYPYNTGTPALHAWLLERVSAVRIGGTGLNDAGELASRVWHCTASGPECCDAHLLAMLDRAVSQRPAALIYNLHGIDGEGWGPVNTDTLSRVLDRIVDHPALVPWNLT